MSEKHDEEEVAAAIAESQEKYESSKGVKARNRVSQIFEEFKKDRPLSVAIFDGFLHEYSRTRKASTVWTDRSHLIRYIKAKDNEDYSNVGTFKSFLSFKSKTEAPKQSSIFEKTELFRFWKEAPSDGIMLRHKFVSLIAYYGCCRIADIVFLDFTAIKISDSQVTVTIQRSKSAASIAKTEFFIPNSDGVPVVDLFQQYIQAQNPQAGRFWRHWRNDRWTSLVVGHNPLAETSRIIATWLEKDDVDSYTGHCFRRSSATAYANSTGSLLGLKRLGGWKSESVAQRYIDTSTVEKKKQAEALGTDAPFPADPLPPKEKKSKIDDGATVFHFTNCSNITLNFQK